MKSNNSNLCHQDLFLAQELAYKPSGFVCCNLIKEVESAEYGAATFEMNNKHIKFRIGKITPTKIGQFVTLWKRSRNGVIQPYDLADMVDLFVVSVRNKEKFGQFVFPKSVLFEKGIISNRSNGGRRAMRVYPPWDIPDSQQAKKTQTWQLVYFLEIDSNKVVLVSRVRDLFDN